jgi:hypothetical protein
VPIGTGAAILERVAFSDLSTSSLAADLGALVVHLPDTAQGGYPFKGTRRCYGSAGFASPSTYP